MEVDVSEGSFHRGGAAMVGSLKVWSVLCPPHGEKKERKQTEGSQTKGRQIIQG